jgi:hypothetical protein
LPIHKLNTLLVICNCGGLATPLFTLILCPDVLLICSSHQTTQVTQLGC